MRAEDMERQRAIIETWARRECGLSGIEPDEDWRYCKESGVMLDIAIRDEDAPNWRHHFAIKAERLLVKLADAGLFLEATGPASADAAVKDDGVER